MNIGIKFEIHRLYIDRFIRFIMLTCIKNFYYFIQIHPNKESMGLELVELEMAAYSVQEEDFVIENTIHKMTNNIEALSMNGDKQEM